MRTSSVIANPFAASTLAEAYDGWFESPAGRLADRLEKALIYRLARPKVGERALDVGTGTGHFALDLAARGLQVTGLDSSQEMMRVARTKSAIVQWKLGDATSLPFADASFDLALSITTLEFVSEPPIVLREMYRVLVPGGRMVVGVLNAQSDMGRAYIREAQASDTPFRHARFYAPDEFVALLRELGPVYWSSSVFFGTDPPRIWVAILREVFGQAFRRGRGALLVGRVDK